MTRQIDQKMTQKWADTYRAKEAVSTFKSSSNDEWKEIIGIELARGGLDWWIKNKRQREEHQLTWYLIIFFDHDFHAYFVHSHKQKLL